LFPRQSTIHNRIDKRQRLAVITPYNQAEGSQCRPLAAQGSAAIAVALIRGVPAKPVLRAPPSNRRGWWTPIRPVWQAGTVADHGGALPIAAPWMASEPARHWIIVTLACVFAFGALCNAWATRGRHFGWMALSAVVALAVAGY
jgi:hypothetical protein